MARPREFDRDDALRKAMHTFWEKGYAATSVDDLTAAMGISRSSLYETFGDKQALFTAALASYLEFTGRKRAAVLAAAGSVTQGMTDLLNGAINFILDGGLPGGCFFTNTATALGALAAPVHNMLERHLGEMEDDFCRFFEHGRQRGELGREKDPRALARFFTGVIRGMTVIASIRKSRRELEDIAAVALAVLK